MNNIFFNAHHSPVGAFASFTLGFPGAKGGVGLELGRPSNQNVYIGVESETENVYNALPFFDENENGSNIIPYDKSTITRDFHLGTDSWRADNLTFTIYTPGYGIPDPENADRDLLKKAIIPAVFAKLVIDNTNSRKAKEAFFGYTLSDPYCGLRHLSYCTEEKLSGIAEGCITAIATDDQTVKSAIDTSIEKILEKTNRQNWVCGLGLTAVLGMAVPAGKKVSYRFAICFYRNGIATSGLDTTYFYTQLFKNIEDVAIFALKHFDDYVSDACERNIEIDKSDLSEDQKFQINHSVKAYYGSTQLLYYDGMPLWVVNEGEYRMMNTFDLTVDQVFYELKMNPWTVKNVLEMYVKRYSYLDKVSLYKNENQYPGGRSFTHDMGVANVFARPEYSVYERSGIDGCFSYMTHEQLVNWILCAALYEEKTHDMEFIKNNISIIKECFESLLNRDNPDPQKRNGIMELESSRTMGGTEITTYDSLDISLGQARNNTYLAVKIWASYLALEKIFRAIDLEDLANYSRIQAERCADTITKAMNKDDYIPAVLFEKSASKIIPVIEGLIFPYYFNCHEALSTQGPFCDLITALKKHLHTVLVKGICIFEDNGWKMSSTSNNTWLSKIYLCQFVARKILGIPWGEEGKAADAAHVNWLLHKELSYWSWSDQIISGRITESKYYPRGVTSILWLEE